MLGDAVAEVSDRERGDQVDVVTAADEAVCDPAGVCQRAACLDAEPEVGVDRDDAAARSQTRLEPRRHAELLEAPGGSPAGVLSVHAGPRDPECRAADLCAGDALATDVGVDDLDRRGQRNRGDTLQQRQDRLRADVLERDQTGSAAHRAERREQASDAKSPQLRDAQVLELAAFGLLEARSKLVRERVRRQNERAPRRHDASSLRSQSSSSVRAAAGATTNPSLTATALARSSSTGASTLTP